jgi:hypothetical protein
MRSETHRQAPAVRLECSVNVGVTVLSNKSCFQRIHNHEARTYGHRRRPNYHTKDTTLHENILSIPSADTGSQRIILRGSIRYSTRVRCSAGLTVRSYRSTRLTSGLLASLGGSFARRIASTRAWRLARRLARSTACASALDGGFPG